jgi:hypothetical protein
MKNYFNRYRRAYRLQHVSLFLELLAYDKSKQFKRIAPKPIQAQPRREAA